MIIGIQRYNCLPSSGQSRLFYTSDSDISVTLVDTIPEILVLSNGHI